MRGSKNRKILAYLVCGVLWFNTGTAQHKQNIVKPGAWDVNAYIHKLKGKKVGIVANQTSTIGHVHLVDSLLHRGIAIEKIFAPEHGFRGDAANGETVKDGKDVKTGIKVVSLYGSKMKPSPADLAGIDILVFDIQDVGVRFYTYLTTLHYVLAAGAENHVAILLLDRPNPNGYFTDGPILDTAFRSVVGMHPIPLVHGMTMGELAQMIIGEKWLGTKDTCHLEVIKNQNWNHNRIYRLPVPPSPNLQSNESVILYPTLGLLEGTVMSMGRGTAHPFECFGAPWLKEGKYKFVPKNIPGKAMDPPFLNDTCYGFFVADFAKNYVEDLRRLYMEWLELLVQECPDKHKFFNPYFDKLAGCKTLRTQLLAGKTAKEIRKSWQPGLEAFEIKRKPYLLYSYYPEEPLQYQ